MLRRRTGLFQGPGRAHPALPIPLPPSKLTCTLPVWPRHSQSGPDTPSQAQTLPACSHPIGSSTSASAFARGAQAAVYDLWRFLNLLHVTAYCGLSQTYNRANLADDFIEAHGLLTDPTLRAELLSIDIDNHGSRAWSTCMVWALEVPPLGHSAPRCMCASVVRSGCVYRPSPRLVLGFGQCP